jgi:protein gp37
MAKTNIDWPGLNETWNPIIGCSCGCSYCYAKRMNNRFHWIPDFSKPEFIMKKLEYPLTVKKPTTFFVCSTADILDKGVKDEWIHNVISVAIARPDHKFMFLSKQPRRYAQFHWPVNCWLGATVESSDKYYRKIPLVAYNTENKKFLSIEPILGKFHELFMELDLIIVGADSTHGAKIPPLEWVKGIKHHNIWYKNNLRKYYPELTNPDIEY